MTHLVPLSLGLIVLLASDSPPLVEEPTQPFRVFADFTHTGRLTGPLKTAAVAPNDFAIAVPLPARVADRHRLADNAEAGVQVTERLGRVRIESAKEVRELVVSVEGEGGRHLRLYRRAKGDWRRVREREPVMDGGNWS